MKVYNLNFSRFRRCNSHAFGDIAKCGSRNIIVDILFNLFWNDFVLYYHNRILLHLIHNKI